MFQKRGDTARTGVAQVKVDSPALMGGSREFPVVPAYSSREASYGCAPKYLRNLLNHEEMRHGTTQTTTNFMMMRITFPPGRRRIPVHNRIDESPIHPHLI